MRGTTTLAGARLRAKKRVKLAVQMKRPAMKNRPAALPVISAVEVLLLMFNREILKTAVAAKYDIKVPARGDPEPLSPNLIKIGPNPHATPFPNPKTKALAGIFEN